MAAPGDAIRQKVALEFAKQGSARLYSHHDLLRFFERALRRVELPVRLTQGFNPKPRLVFPAPLRLGVESRGEWVEIEFVQPIAPEEVRERLAPLMLPGMAIRRAVALPPSRRGRRFAGARYRLSGWAEAGAEMIRVADAARRLSGPGPLRVEHSGPKGLRAVDLSASVCGAAWDGEALTAAIRETGAGTARIDDLLTWLAAETGAEAALIRVERIEVELTV